MEWPEDRTEIFLRVAEAFGTPWGERTERDRALTCGGGICWAAGRLSHSNNTYRWADGFRKKYNIEYAHWWPPEPDYDSERSTFCCFMAVLTDEEFEEIS